MGSFYRRDSIYGVGAAPGLIATTSKEGFLSVCARTALALTKTLSQE